MRLALCEARPARSDRPRPSQLPWTLTSRWTAVSYGWLGSDLEDAVDAAISSGHGSVHRALPPWPGIGSDQTERTSHTDERKPQIAGRPYCNHPMPDA